MKASVRARFVAVKISAVLLVSLLAAGCDKCGNRLHFNAPTLPAACGDNADPAK